MTDHSPAIFRAISIDGAIDHLKDAAGWLSPWGEGTYSDKPADARIQDTQIRRQTRDARLLAVEHIALAIEGLEEIREQINPKAIPIVVPLEKTPEPVEDKALLEPRRRPPTGEVFKVEVELDAAAVPSFDPFLLVFPSPAIPAMNLQSLLGMVALRRPMTYAADGSVDVELVEVLVSKAEANDSGRFVLTGIRGERPESKPGGFVAPRWWPTAILAVVDLNGDEHRLPLIQPANAGAFVPINGTDLRVRATAQFRLDIEAVVVELAIIADSDTYLRGIEIKARGEIDVALLIPRPGAKLGWLIPEPDDADECHLIRAGAPVIRRAVFYARGLESQAREVLGFAGYGRPTGAHSFSTTAVWGEAKVPIPAFGDEVKRNGLHGYEALDDKARARWDSLRSTIEHGGSGYPLTKALGPFHPWGARNGGGTGGEGIDPFSGYQLTVHSRCLAWLGMEATADRLPEPGAPVETIPEGWRCSYESDLRAFKHHDRPHGVRAMTHPRSVAYQTGSEIAVAIIDLVAGRYFQDISPPAIFGQGHPKAHRDIAWLAASQALAYVFWEPSRERRAGLRVWALNFQSWADATAMPSGLTMRAHSSNSHWNPPAWKEQGGQIPDDLDAAKTFMAYLVCFGFWAVGRSMIGGDNNLCALARKATANLSGLRPGNTTPHYVVVAQHDSLVPLTHLVDDLPLVGGDPRHARSALAIAFMETGNSDYLNRAAAHIGAYLWRDIPETVGDEEGGWHSPCNQAAAIYAIAQNPRLFTPSPKATVPQADTSSDERKAPAL